MKPKPQAPEWLTFEATAYTPFCDTGCIGITKTGIDVRDTVTHNGKRIIAVDPSVIPLGSAVQIRLSNGKIIEAAAQDTGGNIQGNRVDLLTANDTEANNFGRQDVKIRILKER
jgi:3D (Asp-Asp-Asp) domain-containing protein